MHVGFHSLRQARRIKHPISVWSQGWYVCQSSCVRQVVHGADSVPVSDTHPVPLNRLNIIHLHTTAVAYEPSPQKQSLASLPVTAPLLSDELPPVANSPYNSRTSIRFFCPSIWGLYPAVLSSSFRLDFCRRGNSSRVALTRNDTEISLNDQVEWRCPTCAGCLQTHLDEGECGLSTARIRCTDLNLKHLGARQSRWLRTQRFGLEHVAATSPSSSVNCVSDSLSPLGSRRLSPSSRKVSLPVLLTQFGVSSASTATSSTRSNPITSRRGPLA